MYALWLAEIEAKRKWDGIDNCRRDMLKRRKVLDPRLALVTAETADDIASKQEALKELSEICRRCGECELADSS